MKLREREPDAGRGERSAPQPASVQRARHTPGAGGMLLDRQATAGNQAVLRMLQSPGSDLHQEDEQVRRTEAEGPKPSAGLRTKLTVSDPGDACEREATAMASRVVRRTPTPQAARPTPAPAAARATTARATTARSAVARSAEQGPAAMGGGLGKVESAMADAGNGEPLGMELRESIEPHLGIDLSGVRVKRDGAAGDAAAAIGARAFTTGSTIFLGKGESPTDLELMAHEATHVAQNHTEPALHAAVKRDFLDDVGDAVGDAVDFVIPDAVYDLIREIPGYTLLTLIAGKDLIDDSPIGENRDELIEQLLSYGPFGDTVSVALKSMDVIGQVIDLVTGGLAAHNLTLTRIGDDVSNAWDEMGVTEGIDGNIAIARRYLDGILNDAGEFVDSIVEQVIEWVREAIAPIAEQQLKDSPEIQPYWDLAKKVFHYNPLTGENVDAPTAEILGDFLRLIGQEDALTRMEENGTLADTAAWLDTQLATFTGIKDDVVQLFVDAWEAIQPANLPNLLDTLPELAQRAWQILTRIVEFGTTLIAKVVELVKNSLLGWLSENASEIHGFPMICVIVEKDPFTGRPCPRTAENLIGGFISLLPNGTEIYDELSESGVIASAGSRIENAMSRLGISVEMVTETFLGVWNLVTLESLARPLDTFNEIIDLFGDPIARIIEFVVEVIQVVIELILRLMNFPSELLGNIIANTAQAIDDVMADPVGFLLNMLEALKEGLSGFFDGIGTYLLQGLADWLFRGLSSIGVSIPEDLSLESVLDTVLQVLDLSIDKLWEKLAEHIGEERVAQMRGTLDQLSGAWQFIQDVQAGGIGAVWEYVQDQLAGLWDMLLSAAMEWITTTIIERVTARLLSMLDPTGVMAVVNSMIAFYGAVESAIEYLRDILMIVDDYVQTFADVAAGNTGPGAEKIESGLADAIPVAIGFLANQAGIGDVPEKVVEIIEGLRELVDEALDWLIGQAVRLGSAALGALGLGPEAEPEAQAEQEGADAAAGAQTGDEPVSESGPVDVPFKLGTEDHHVYTDPAGDLLVASNNPQPLSNLDQLRSLHTSYRALPADAPNTHRKEIIDQMIAMIKADPSLVAQLADEGIGSPPNLGEILPYGANVPTFQPQPGQPSFAPMWEMTREHVIPFDLGRALWEAVSVAVPGRGGWQDRNQTTIKIYKRAADIKTHQGSEREISQQFASDLRAANIAQLLREATSGAIGAGIPEDERDESAARAVVADIVAALSAARTISVQRTRDAITEEHGETGHRMPKTNGEIRGETQPQPAMAEVFDAAQQQHTDLQELAARALLERE